MARGESRRLAHRPLVKGLESSNADLRGQFFVGHEQKGGREEGKKGDEEEGRQSGGQEKIKIGKWARDAENNDNNAINPLSR